MYPQSPNKIVRNTAEMVLELRKNFELLHLPNHLTTDVQTVTNLNKLQYSPIMNPMDPVFRTPNSIMYPPQAIHPSASKQKSRACRSATFSSADSDSSSGSIKYSSSPSRRRNRKKLPPIGVFWDIENCRVPMGRSAAGVIQKVREIFFKGFREAEFVVVCDVSKENSNIIREINDAQVNLIHIAATAKNAADDKLRQAMRRFADTHRFPAAVLLISSDINFAPDLSDLRHRKRLHIILVHNFHTSEAIISCANEHYLFESIAQAAPPRFYEPVNETEVVEVIIWNLPVTKSLQRIRQRLYQLSNNCGGRVGFVDMECGTATIKFNTMEFGLRAQKRMEGEDVYGNRISVSFPRPYASHFPVKQQTIFPKPSYQNEFPNNYQMQPYNMFANGIQTGLPNMPLPPANNVLMPTDYQPNENEQVYHNQIFDQMMKERNQPIRNVNQEELQFKGPEGFRPIRGVHSNSMPQPKLNVDHSAFAKPFLNDAPTRDFNSTSKPFWSVEEPKSSEVATQLDAQLAISRLHRQRVGNKRIIINQSISNGPNRDQLKAQIIGLLQEVPGNKLPVFKFRELFETRYLTTISISELYRFQDACSVIDEPSGRMICLNTETSSNTPSPDSSFYDMIYCLKHDNTKKNVGWAEKEVAELPNVRIGLKVFTGKLHMLLQNHKGTLPLQSFQACYEAVIHEPLPIDETGVPLEHLVTCVAGVELRQGPAKQIIWSTTSSSEDVIEDASNYSGLADRQSPNNTPLATHLALFSRELVELLRVSPNCQISFTRFIPAYHHHFGRQCRVADYGFTRLADLFESLSRVVQILGEGNKRMITLSHRTQVRRFTGDLLRILKGSTSRQITVQDFAAAAEKSLGRPWDPVSYGVCELEDLLSAVPEHIVVVTPMQDNNTVIGLPKREQTPDEVYRTQQFAIQVIELLRHEPHCSMFFNKFVPAYHHYFNQQCRVSDYGFTKLIELFEVIPEIVQIVDQPGEERIIRLTIKEALKILSNQIIQLIINRTSGKPEQSVLLSELPSLYLTEYGFKLKPEEYQCNSFEDLLRKMEDSIIVAKNMVSLVDRSAYKTLGLRIWRILLDSNDFCLTPTMLLQNYRLLYNQHYELNQLKEISTIVQVTCRNNEPHLTLTSLYKFAAQAYIVLYDSCFGTTTVGLFEHLYTERFGAVDPESADCPNMSALIHSIPDILIVSGRTKSKQTISLNPQLASVGVPLPERIKTESPKWVPEKSVSSLEATVQEFLWPTNVYSTDLELKYSPPKPDTPPSKQAVMWHNLWGTPTRDDSNLVIPMPNLNQEQDSLLTLMSPSSYLISAMSLTDQSQLMSPPTSALPQPNFDSDAESTDSKTESFHSCTTPNRCKRKLRVAAHFKSPISLQ